MNNYRVIGFIPARSGSTRIKDKNVRFLMNRPLIYWTVMKAIKSKKFHKIIFSSDSNRYYKILIKYLKKDNVNFHNLIFDKRNINHAKKKSKIFDYLKHDLLKKFNFHKQDLLVQMLPTCPLRSIMSIKALIDYSISKNKNCFSACEYDFHHSFGFLLKGDNWRPVFKNSPMLTGKTQSQNQSKFYHPNGAVNCLFVKSLDFKKKSIYQNALPFIIPKLESFDIDTEDDFKILKLISKNLLKK